MKLPDHRPWDAADIMTPDDWWKIKHFAHDKYVTGGMTLLEAYVQATISVLHQKQLTIRTDRYKDGLDIVQPLKLKDRK